MYGFRRRIYSALRRAICSAPYQLTSAHTVSLVRAEYPSRDRKNSEMARKNTEMLSPPFMRPLANHSFRKAKTRGELAQPTKFF